MMRDGWMSLVGRPFPLVESGVVLFLPKGLDLLRCEVRWCHLFGRH